MANFTNNHLDTFYGVMKVAFFHASQVAIIERLDLHWIAIVNARQSGRPVGSHIVGVVVHVDVSASSRRIAIQGHSAVVGSTIRVLVDRKVIASHSQWALGYRSITSTHDDCLSINKPNTLDKTISSPNLAQNLFNAI